MSARKPAELIDAEYVELGKGYESISRDALQDRRLSYKARGIMSYLKSKPPKWRTNTQAIADDSDKDGYEAVNSGIRELEDLGYFARLKRQGAGGRWEWLWIYSDDPRAVAVRKARWRESGPESPRRGPRRGPSAANAAEGVAADETGEPAGQTVSGFSVHGSSEHGETVDGSPMFGEPPNNREIQRRDQEREGGGNLEGNVTSEATAFATPPRAFSLNDRSTWQCRTHLAEPPPEPGAFRPACGPCGGVREWAEAQLAAQAAAAEEAEAARAVACCWHDAAGDMIDPATGGPFLPVVKCDHRTGPDVVAARIAEQVAAREARPRAEAGRAEARRLYRPTSRYRSKAPIPMETVTP